jgi:site-specific DNA recombinase
MTAEPAAGLQKRAILYARVSYDDRDTDSRNLAGQLEMAREYAAGRGYQIVGELSEDDRGASGALIELPQLQRVLTLAEHRAIDVVVTREVDRLSRTLVKQLLIESRLRDLGVEVEYVLADYEDSPEGRLNKLIRAVIAEFEREKIKERMARGRYLAARSGKVLLHGGPAYGYDAIEEPPGVRVNETKAEVVRELFEAYVRGGSLREIARRFSARGIPTGSDLRGRNAHRGEWHPASLRWMLMNEAYTGRWLYGPQEVEVEIPKIVDRQVWLKAQARLKANRDQLRARPVEEYLFRSRVFCGECGRHMVTRSLKVDGLPFKYYRCSGKKPPASGCRSPWFAAELVDDEVCGFLVDLLGRPEILREAVDQLRQDGASLDWLERQVAEADGVLEIARRQLGRLLDLYLAGSFDLQMLEDRKGVLHAEIALAEQRRLQLLEDLDRARRMDTSLLQDALAGAGQVLGQIEDFAARRSLVDELDVWLVLQSSGRHRSYQRWATVNVERWEGVGRVELLDRHRRPSRETPERHRDPVTGQWVRRTGS